MGLFSEIIGEANNKIKDKWVRELKNAISNRDWSEVERITKIMEKYDFAN